MSGRRSEDQGNPPPEQLRPSGKTGVGNASEYFFFLKENCPEEIDPVSEGKEAVGTEMNLDESGSFFLTCKENA